MNGSYLISLDVHGGFTQVAVMSGQGRLLRQARVATALPELRRVIEQVRSPRVVVLEEGPLADWLLRGLQGSAERVVCCDPRRNAHIAKDGDKDDPIDVVKLGHLYRGGFVREVHHPQTAERMAFKQFVGLYHDRVRNAVRQGQRISALLRQHGVFVGQLQLLDRARAAALLSQLPAGGLRFGARLLVREYTLARVDLVSVRRRLRSESRRYEPIRRFMEAPGVKLVRAATFFAYVDTPGRFARKQALWRYMGIGLQRRHSGDGPVQLRVPPSVQVCRPLKNMILGAAKSAIAARCNPFAERYEEWRHAGLTPRNARRNVARSLAATLWGLWKSGSVYCPVRAGGRPAAAAETVVDRVDG